MTKFIQDLILKLRAIKNGMTLNAAQWVGQPIATVDIDNAITDLEGADNAIEAAKDTLQQKRTDGRTEVKTKEDGIYSQAVNLATGIHNSDQVKLNEYDIKLRAPGVPLPIPQKAVIASIKDDDDGIGFKMKVQVLADATSYEWQKGEAPQPNQTSLPTPYPFWRTTTKTTVVDDDVTAGTRYFYRVRGVNSTGPGEWSEPVSHVQ